VIIPLAAIVGATASAPLLVLDIIRPGGPLIELIFIPAFIACTYAMRRFARSADEVRKLSGASPVVLLRSFADDGGLKVRGYWGGGFFLKEPFERRLSRVLSRFGPFVAVGKPGERLPPFGAARSYENDQKWQIKVLELIRSCKLIVILAGSTTGLKWELERIINEGYHSKLLILCHPSARLSATSG
jgi:hypothetical protein